MFADVGMVRRGLEGNVESEGDIEIPDLCDQAAEVFDGAEVRVDGLVAPVCGADGPWTSNLPGLRLWIVVAALAEVHPDGMDGWEIDDVKAHIRDVGQEI